MGRRKRSTLESISPVVSLSIADYSKRVHLFRRDDQGNCGTVVYFAEFIFFPNTAAITTFIIQAIFTIITMIIIAIIIISILFPFPSSITSPISRTRGQRLTLALPVFSLPLLFEFSTLYLIDTHELGTSTYRGAHLIKGGDALCSKVGVHFLKSIERHIE